MAETKAKKSTAYTRALDSLTRYLALRDHSRAELRQKLTRRHDPELVDHLLLEADANGWLASEESVAEKLVAALERRNKSRRYIEGQLRSKRLPVPPKNEEAELSAARHLIERKFGPPSEMSYEEKTKAMRFLSYRGFNGNAIRQVLNEK